MQKIKWYILVGIVSVCIGVGIGLLLGAGSAKSATTGKLSSIEHDYLQAYNRELVLNTGLRQELVTIRAKLADSEVDVAAGQHALAAIGESVKRFDAGNQQRSTSGAGLAQQGSDLIDKCIAIVRELRSAITATDNKPH